MTDYPQRREADRALPRGGFALIVSMVLMGFIMLLLLSLSALTRVQTEVAGADDLRRQARMNALLGLNVAMAQLQELAGADRRVTATALIERNGAGAVMAPLNGARHWTGVWGHGDAPEAMSSQPVFLNWLVSGNEERRISLRADGAVTNVSGTLAFTPETPLPQVSAGTEASERLQSGSRDWRLLVGANSADGVDNYVVAPVVPLRDGDGTLRGGYAYWVGDEGVKAALHVVEDDAVLYPEAGAEGERKARLRYRRPGRMGAEALDTDWVTALAAAGETDTEAGALLRRQLEQMVLTEQFQLLDAVPEGFLRKHFHDATIWSYGVLSDTLGGGLRKDLSAGFAAGTGKNDRPTGLVWEKSKAQVSTEGPFWQGLRSWYQFADQADEALPILKADRDGRHPLSPVVASWQWFVQALVSSATNTEGKTEYRLGYRMYPALVLWNPYNVTLKSATLHGNYANNAILTSGKRGNSRHVVFATRVWKSGSASNNTFPAAFAEDAQFIAPWSEATATSSGTPYPAPFRFLVDTGDMAPGMAYVYTLKADVAYAGTAAANYRLERGWNFDGSLNTAVTAWAPTSFTLPESESDADYQIGFWISSGSIGGDLDQYDWDSSFSGVTNDQAWGIIGNDVLDIDENPPANSLRLQAVYGVNASLRSAQVSSMWSERDARRLSVVLGTSGGSIGFYGQRWALKVSEANDIFSGPAGSGEAEFNNPVRWLANYNPRTAFSDRTPYERQNLTNNGYYNTNPAYNRVTALAHRAGTAFDPMAEWFTISHDAATAAAYTGLSQKPYAGTPVPVILFDVPRPDSRVLSIGALQHANVHRPTDAEALGWTSVATPAYAIGNSLADPRVGLERYRVAARSISSRTSSYPASEYLIDYSYVLNRSLWDGYFFSSVPQGGQAVTFPLENARYVSHAATDASIMADLRDYDKAASRLLVKGAFNVNSASAAAWRALLASFNAAPVNGETVAASAPYPRLAAPTHALFDPDRESAPDASGDSGAYRGGFRALSRPQINALADAIVEQVRLRGPFLSLADFVNRSLAGTEEEQLSGVLAAALKETQINAGFKTAAVTIKSGATMDGSIDMARNAYEGLSAEHVPGWLTQADLLQSLGPVLSARSDTFVIRVCGEASRPVSDEAVALAWCEAVVQRMPAYSNGDAASAAPTRDNQLYGREFRIVSLRWLTQEEI